MIIDFMLGPGGLVTFIIGGALLFLVTLIVMEMYYRWQERRDHEGD